MPILSLCRRFLDCGSLPRSVVTRAGGLTTHFLTTVEVIEQIACLLSARSSGLHSPIKCLVPHIQLGQKNMVISALLGESTTKDTDPAMLSIAYKEFLGDSPLWFKNIIIAFLLICWPLKLIAGTTILGWVFIAMFILTLAMALKCYPLQSGGVVALAILALGLTTPDTVWYEIQQNLPVIALLIFMVSFIYFMKPLLSFIFARIIVGIQNKVALSLLFSFMAAFLSAFLDALTVTAVLIAVFVALYGVYERVVTSQSEGGDLSEESLEGFRTFIRSLVMHGAVGTALGGVTTMVGEPQNLLIAEKMDWEFLEFVYAMSHVTIPCRHRRVHHLRRARTRGLVRLRRKTRQQCARRLAGLCR